MEAEITSPSKKERRWRRWEWLLLLLALLTSFVCVFCSTTLALDWWEDSLTPASLLAQRRADYRLGSRDQVKFGFLDPAVVGQAATDRARLYVTPAKGSRNSGTPVTIAWLPATPTRIANSGSQPPALPGESGSGPGGPDPSNPLPSPAAGSTATPDSSPTSFAVPTGTAQPTPTAAGGTATPQPTETLASTATPASTPTPQNSPTAAPTWTLPPPPPTSGPTSKPEPTDPPPSTLPPATATATVPPTNTAMPTDTPTVPPTPTETATPGGPLLPIRPIFEGPTVDNGDGTCTATFGYLNENSFEVTIPVGSDNRFNPAPEDRGQPAVFQPGRVMNAVKITFSGGALVWSLPGRTATAGPTGSCVTYTIAGQVRNDTTYSGGSGSDAGICDSTMQGVTVNLYQSGLFQTTTTTDASCQYSFSALSAGTYTVEVDATTFNGPPGTLPEQTWEYNTGGDVGARGGDDPAIANDHRVDVTIGPSATVNFSFSYKAVVNTLDSGQGSLRQAIENANAIGGDTVVFGLFGSGSHTIQPVTLLPKLQGNVTIDGTTQPGYATGTPVIVLDGLTGTGNLAEGLTLGSGNNQVRGLIITRFENGLAVGGTSNLIGENRIESNTKNGIHVVNSSDNIISQNSIANNGFSGIGIASVSGSPMSDRQIIKGNSITGNNNHGIYLKNVSDSSIGGPGAGEGNVIGSNGDDGIYLEANADGNAIQGNYIGVGADGTTAMGNGNLGIGIVDSSSNTIGGTESGAGNIIAHSHNDGIEIWDDSGTSVKNAIRQNRVFSNTNIGIDLDKGYVTDNDSDDSDTGPNNLQNFPILHAVSLGSGLTVTGTLTSTVNTDFFIELFSNSVGDSRGHGEGQYYLDSFSVTTNGTGVAPFVHTYSGPVTGTFITATATDPDGNTSEFGPNVVP